MIPVSQREFVEFKDKDGVLFKFRPKSGILEREMFNIFKENISVDEKLRLTDEFVDKILLAPEYKDENGEPVKPSDKLNSQEKQMVLGFWHEANRLAVEEKKS